VTRALLTLYELDRPKLQELTKELRAALAEDDRAALGALLEIEPPPGQLVDAFVLPPGHERAAPLFAAVARASKKRALTPVMTSSDPALEGRLRGFEPLRADAALGRLCDKLLDPRRLPWYLRRPGATGGWLDGGGRRELAAGLRRLRGALVPELAELADVLEQAEADVVLHDGL
jgi:hypothetical protein